MLLVFKSPYVVEIIHSGGIHTKQTKTKYNFLYLSKTKHPELLQIHAIFPNFALKLCIEIHNPEANTLLYMQQSISKIVFL